MYILGIESSCDETGVAVYGRDLGLMSHVLHTQIPMHAEYGGVVPELASRDHIKRLVPLTRLALEQAGIGQQDLAAVCYTAGPGLIGALLTGAMYAGALAYALKIPAVPVHHMEAHLLAPMLEKVKPSLPYVALLISGGHTLLILVENPGEYQLLGQSVDDAVGEAFDKTAKLLGIPYPGGPGLEKLAMQGDAAAFNFPRPMLHSKELDFSFAGLKTAVLLAIEAQPKGDSSRYADIARSFTQAVTDTLTHKCRSALKRCHCHNLVVAGGVSANSMIRESLSALMTEVGGRVFFARREFCTDNGAMVAYAGMQRFVSGQCGTYAVKVHPRWSLSDLPGL